MTFSPAPIRVRNPRTGTDDYQFTPASPDTLARMAAALRAAQPDWAALGGEGRTAVLREWQAVLNAHTDRLLTALTADTGRKALSRQEIISVTGGIDRWTALAPDLLQESERPSAVLPDLVLGQQLSPHPLVGVISPWNFPLLLSFSDTLPALMAGCAVIVKPSEVTPRFVEPLMDTVRAVPALHKIFRMVQGDGATGAALVDQVDLIAFTGSVATGRKVGEAAAARFIPAFLELGGKDASIVMAGSDPDRTATALIRASVAATGQACQSIERIYVQRPLFDDLVAALTAQARATPLSYPDPDQGIVGPLIFEKQADIIRAHLADAVAKGATIHCGGTIETHGGGLWIAPTVVTGVTHDMALMTEETFGPILPVMPFDTADEAIALANDTCFGLSASVFAPDETEALAIARRIDAGGISINDAGLTTMVWEQEKESFNLSGMGASRMGPTGLTRFLRKKALFINRGTAMPIQAFAETGRLGAMPRISAFGVAVCG